VVNSGVQSRILLLGILSMGILLTSNSFPSDTCTVSGSRVTSNPHLPNLHHQFHQLSNFSTMWSSCTTHALRVGKRQPQLTQARDQGFVEELELMAHIPNPCPKAIAETFQLPRDLTSFLSDFLLTTINFSQASTTVAPCGFPG
jgi:hypothetical protein